MIEIQNNKKKNIKYIFIFLLLIIFFAFILNFTFNFIQNKIVSIINSEQFEKYIFYKIDHFLERASEGELNDQEIDKYTIMLGKIYKKYKPVIDNLEKKN